jgi:hypothetical protein
VVGRGPQLRQLQARQATHGPAGGPQDMVLGPSRDFYGFFLE